MRRMLAMSKRIMQRAGVAGAAALVVVAAAWPTPPASAAAVRNPEDLLIVDCLLPGQVRKLGRQATFLSARRPLRTSQADCEIRGGEFVSYDRANYQTALEVWMGQAEAGDAEAQNYVGEIYLKGLGTAPDYAKAAGWFEKAVAQGNKRAMINLGYIHEEGLGVPRDLARALNLYRDASGSKDELLFASTVTAQAEAAKAEIASLRQTVEEQKAEAQRLRTEIDGLKRQLDERRASLSRSEKALADARAELVARQAELTPPAEARQLKALQAELDARGTTLTAQKQVLERDRAGVAAEVEASRVRLAELKAREAELQAPDASGREELGRVRAAATDLALALDEALQKMDDLQKRVAETDARLNEQQAQFDAERKRMQAVLTGSQQDRELLILLEQQLSQKQREVSQARAQVVSLERQIALPAPSGVSVAALGAGPRLEIIDPPLTAVRGKPAAMVRASVGSSEVLGKVVARAGLTSVEVNGSVVAVGANGLFRVNVPVTEDGSTIKVAAIDRAGARAALEFTLLPLASGRASAVAPAPTAGARPVPRNLKLGTYHALVIGNDGYAGYPKLSSAAADARKVGAVLEKRYGFRTRIITDGSRYDVLAALNELRESLTADDNLVVYFAGHGEIDARSKEGYWVPVDGRPGEPSTWISNRAISDILNTMQARHVMVVADSCYSGAMTRASVPAFNPAMSDAQWTQWLTDRTGSRSRTALTSGGLAPVPDASAGGNSLFALAFVAALEDNNGLLEGQRLFRDVSLSLATVAADAALPQSPEYAPIQFAGHEAGEFFFRPRG
jgi:hypothetical protein